MQQQHRVPPGSPRRTMVSGGPGVGLHDRNDLIDERTGLLRPEAPGSSPVPSPSTDRRRSSTGSAHGGAPVTMGLRKRSVVSISSTSAGQANGTGWKLKYQDFMPEKNSSSDGDDWDSQESFSSLVSRASKWLSMNPDVRVKSCQTITWMSHTRNALRANFSELMVMSKSIADHATTYHIRGLRLWLVPASTAPRVSSSAEPPADSSTSSKSPLSCIDFTPDRTKTSTIQGLVTLVNGEIDEQQLKGTVVMVETVTVPIIDGVLDSGVTRWKENVNDDNQYAYVLRVYCSLGPRGAGNTQPVNRIGIKDVIPRPTEDGFEGFEDLCDRANVWFKDQTSVEIVNLQSIMVLKDPGAPHSETGSACYFTSPGSASDSPVEYFRILRIVLMRAPKHGRSAAVKSLELTGVKMADGGGGGGGYPSSERRPSVLINDGSPNAASHSLFTYETFTPELVRGCSAAAVRSNVDGLVNLSNKVETMNETFSKVIAFLQNSGSTDVICAEVVFNPIQLYINASDCVSALPDEINFLYTIRLFLSRPQGRHDGSQRSVRRASNLSVCRAANDQPSTGLGRNGSVTAVGGGDQQHPGPIFLRHVVSRRFPYRWLILAISAISCMTVIVAVSVIYSNR